MLPAPDGSNFEAPKMCDESELQSPERAADIRKADLHFADTFIFKSISEATRRTYSMAIRGFFGFVKHVHPAQVTPQHVIAYRDHLLNSKKSANTVALKLSILRSFYDFLIADGHLERNPASTRLVPPPPASDTPAGRALTPKEVRHLLSEPDRTTAEGARDHALMLLMLRLSLRVTEACTARLSYIKWSHGRWTLRLKVKRGREEVWPLPPDVKCAIDYYLELDRERRATLGTGAKTSISSSPTRITAPSNSRSRCRLAMRTGL